MRTLLHLSSIALCAWIHVAETSQATSPQRNKLPQAAAAPTDSQAPKFADARALLWEPGVKNAYPRWSKDGKRVLYQSNRTGKWQLHLMHSDGSHARAITSHDANNSFPDWSPDNQSVAFVSDRDGNEEIYILRMDGFSMKNLTNSPSRDIHPYWSPDGTKLLFNSTRDVDRLQIYEMSADGSQARRLVDSLDDDSCARISPAGDRILYLANLATGQDDVMLRRRDGTDPVNLTKDRVRDGWPTWTPDGQRIVYCSARDDRFKLFTMDADGSRPQQISFPEAGFEDVRPNVSSDQKRVVFNRESGETIGICVIDLPPATAAAAK